MRKWIFFIFSSSWKKFESDPGGTFTRQRQSIADGVYRSGVFQDQADFNARAKFWVAAPDSMEGRLVGASSLQTTLAIGVEVESRPYLMAKLQDAQITAPNIAKMMKEINKLTFDPAGATMQTEGNILRVGVRSDTPTPGGYLIGINPYNERVELKFQGGSLQNLLSKLTRPLWLLGGVAVLLLVRKRNHG